MESFNIFSHKVRVRSCGILIENNKILLVKHNHIGPKDFFWIPPGGGVEFSSTLENTMIREFKEETNLDVIIDQLLFTTEHIDNNFHAIEFFFSVKKIGGNEKLGIDPELSPDKQILSELKWMSLDDIHRLDPLTIHHSLHNLQNINDVLKKNGLLKNS